MGKEKAFERRSELITAAFREFAAHGYEAASVNRIIAEADISKGTFYYHFPSKEDLFFFLVDYAVQQRLAYIAAHMPWEAAREQDVFAMLKAQAKIGVEFALEHADQVQFAVRAARENGPVAVRLLERLGLRTADILAPLLSDAMAKEEVRSDLGPSFPVVMLGHLLLSFNQLFVNPDQVPDRERIYADLDRYFAFIKHGLAGPGAKGG